MKNIINKNADALSAGTFTNVEPEQLPGVLQQPGVLQDESITRSFTKDGKIKLTQSEYGALGGRPIKWTEERLVEVGEKLIEWLKDDNNIFLNKFLLENDLDLDLLTDFQDKHERFSVLIKKARHICESKLVEKAITGKHKEVFSIFLLKSKYGYDDKSGVAQSNGNPIYINFSGLPESKTPINIGYTEQPPIQISPGVELQQSQLPPVEHQPVELQQSQLPPTVEHQPIKVQAEPEAKDIEDADVMP